MSTSLRARVETVCQQAAQPLRAREIATAAGLTYRQTIDALNALFNAERVARHGRKSGSRWHRPEPKTPNHAALRLQAALHCAIA